MAKGRVDIRFNKNRGNSRFRFYGVYPDTQEMILTALEIARAEAGTEHDTVALDCICLHFLGSYPHAKLLPQWNPKTPDNGADAPGV